MTREHINLLIEAKHEINRLRRVNEILGAKVEVMEDFMQVLHTRPVIREQGATIDIAWQLDQVIQAEEQIKAQAPR